MVLLGYLSPMLGMGSPSSLTKLTTPEPHTAGAVDVLMDAVMAVVGSSFSFDLATRM